MDKFPPRFHEEKFKEIINEKETDFHKKQSELMRETRSQIVHSFKEQMNIGKTEIIFEFPDELKLDSKKELLKEIVDRFPNCKMWWWRVVEYADVEEWCVLKKDDLRVCWKYKIKLM